MCLYGNIRHLRTNQLKSLLLFEEISHYTVYVKTLHLNLAYILFPVMSMGIIVIKCHICIPIAVVWCSIPQPWVWKNVFLV